MSEANLSPRGVRSTVKSDFSYMFKDEIEELSSKSKKERVEFVDKVVRQFVDYSPSVRSMMIWNIIYKEYLKKSWLT